MYFIALFQDPYDVTIPNSQNLQKKQKPQAFKFWIQNDFNSQLKLISIFKIVVNNSVHGLRTPNEGINRRNLKIWANVADKTCFGRT